MYAVRPEGGHTRWSQGRYSERHGCFIKYEQERRGAELASWLVREPRDWSPRMVRMVGAVIRRVGPCGLEASGDPYRMLVRSVVYQQLAGSAAGAILGRVKARFGGRIPRPERLLAATDAELRSDGLSRQKIAAIRGVAAHMLLMFSLGRPDVLPVGDYGVRKGAQIVYELEDLPKPKELASLAECWRPYRSVGAWYLWAVVDQ